MQPQQPIRNQLSKLETEKWWTEPTLFCVMLNDQLAAHIRQFNMRINKVKQL